MYDDPSTTVGFMPHALEHILAGYCLARNVVQSAGYSSEIDWLGSRRFDAIGESEFLREYAWVVLTSGMREAVVRQRFGAISRCFFEWESAERIVAHAESCRSLALRYFNHVGKIRAIVQAACHIKSVGFGPFKDSIREEPLMTLQTLPFLGPTTSCHLAKNLGLPFAKPDRHLTRLSQAAGYADVQEFCATISKRVGDPIHVVDLVLWRFATVERNYLALFCTAGNGDVRPCEGTAWSPSSCKATLIRFVRRCYNRTSA